MSHLENLLFQLQQVKEEATNWNTILFALYYHDIVYDIIKSNNEEKSAELAEKKLKLLGVPDQEIAQVKSIILATRSHSISEDKDINIFTDADLSILGQSWDMYEKYYQNVRQEYKVYPISLYKMGRIRVLQHFLSMERIYKTSYFYQNCEQLAKINLQREIDELNKE